MNVIQVRSPFTIHIDESGQLATQLKLYIWNKGDAEPTVPNYTLSKDVPSIVNRLCKYNISKYLQEFIDPITAVKTGVIDVENNKAWCFFRVERYSCLSSKDMALLDTTDYIGLNGFYDSIGNAQVNESINYKQLIYQNNYNYEKNKQGYFNLLVDFDVHDYQINYSTAGFNYYFRLRDIFDFSGVNLLKIPYAYNVSYSVSLYSLDNDETIFTINSIPVYESRYTPIECSFINARGGWQFLTFFKASSNSISVKGSEFETLTDGIVRGKSKVFNINGTEAVKCNTGWLDENYNILIRDLLLSETVLLDGKPAKLKTKSQTYKTELYDKLINYEIEFEYNYDLINNVVW